MNPKQHHQRKVDLNNECALNTGAGNLDRFSKAEAEDDCEDIITELKRVKQQLLTARASLEHSAIDARDAAIRARLAERSRLAQILHDGLQQLLVAAKMRLSSSIRSTQPQLTEAAAAQALRLLTDAIEVSRTLTMDLSPLHFVEEGLGPALIWLSEWFATHHGLKVTVEVTTDAEPESESLRTLVFQGVREILFNAVKHAGIDNARVRMLRTESEIQIIVEDKGAGFEPASVEANSDGFGLFSVKRRLELLGGAMEVVSAPGAGTRVTLKAPLMQRASQQASPCATANNY